MKTDIPPKHRGMFNAFKGCMSRVKSRIVNDTTQGIKISQNGSIQVLTRTGDIEDWSLEQVSSALEKALRALEEHAEHFQQVSSRIKNFINQAIGKALSIDSVINNHLISGALKRTAASDTISIFKRLKQITLTVIFTTTRNFSIQKNLSISA